VVICHRLDRMGPEPGRPAACRARTHSTPRQGRIHDGGSCIHWRGQRTEQTSLSVMVTIAEFERSLILGRQREGVALAKAAGKYKGRRPSLSGERAAELRRRTAYGGPKDNLARGVEILRILCISICNRSSARTPSDFLRPVEDDHGLSKRQLTSDLIGSCPMLPGGPHAPENIHAAKRPPALLTYVRED
jgi:hypothetical protein